MGKSLYIVTLKSDKILDFEKIILKCLPLYIPADIFLSNLAEKLNVILSNLKVKRKKTLDKVPNRASVCWTYFERVIVLSQKVLGNFT